LSEIHGGSDVPSNLIEAVKEGDTWKIYGNKFFCSATHADYAIITAKPQGSEKVGLFVLPSWLPGNKEKEIRNSYTIDRIKWKMGTSELTTGELTFNGTVVYPAGPLEKGVANVVGIVLTYSRLTVGLSCAAFMTRAVREAKKYSEFREAFGITIGSFPMVKWQIDDLDKTAKRTTAGAFKLYSEFMKLEEGLKGGFSKDGPAGMMKKRFEIRELIMLQKIATSLDCTDTIRGAMSIFGGHGVMEDFSSLPRLYRDSAINELWEGPRNVLLTQVHNDFKKTAGSYKPSEFVSNVLSGANPSIIKELGNELEAYVSHPNLITMDEKTLEITRKWDDYWHRFFHAYQDIAMDEIEKP
jgi:alkylation response protein AidB-like acyl-CoA dehydrogenase